MLGKSTQLPAIGSADLDNYSLISLFSISEKLVKATLYISAQSLLEKEQIVSVRDKSYLTNFFSFLHGKKENSLKNKITMPLYLEYKIS